MLRRSKVQKVSYVSAEEIQAKLESADGVSAASVLQLYDFGKQLVSEAQQRSAYIDAKLGNYLTWTSALLGVLLLDQTLAKEPSALAQLIGIIATFLGVATFITCYFGMRTALLPSPSERDWFRDGLLNDGETLQKFHLLALLEEHQHAQQEIFRKSTRMREVEFLLMVTGILAGAKILLIVLPAFWRIVFP